MAVEHSTNPVNSFLICVSEDFKYLRDLFMSEGRMEQEVDK